jgi:glutathione peroxidase
MLPAMKVLRMFTFALLGGVLSAVGGAWAQAGREAIDWGAVSIDSLEGGRLDTAAFKGKVVLLVNTASFCGFTGQYKDLEALYRRYKDRGLVILGVPSNDFGEQEPGSNAEIKKFCDANFDVSFPMTDKAVVSGAGAHPLYRWAARQTGALGVPTWNFHKILVGRDGRILDWFTAAGGMGPKIDRAIEAAL